MEKPSSWAGTQESLANCIFAIGLVIILITASKISSLPEIAMLAASSITMFYFWWGYLFLAKSGLESRKITEYLYDFIVTMLLMGLFYITGLTNENKQKFWLIAYFILFIGAVIKNALLLNRENSKSKIIFLKEKIRIDSGAAAFIFVLVLAAIFLKMEMFAILGIFAMELCHILYVGIYSNFYEKYKNL
ncbi:MAG TPA: hypothetical protein VJI52_00560 [Candidatus Nanoarchaeia archaeon]|nr:hypothetical protein [Candidatus Nanoarchaeia archaeon]